MALLTGGNIANIERVKITTEEEPTKTYVFETATSCSFNASVSAGNETEQRVKNTIMGLLKTEDIVKGYDLELEDQRLIMEVLALVDGGTLTNGSGSTWEKYASPVAGSTVTRKAFTMELFTSDRDTDGEALEYYCWKFAHCKGSPISGSMQDGSFATNKYSIKSRPPKGTSPMEITRVTELPAVS